MATETFYSNSLEQLYENLQRKMFCDPSFVENVIIVPSKNTKNFLTEKLALDEKYTIASFLKFVEISKIDNFLSDYYESTSSFLEIYRN